MRRTDPTPATVKAVRDRDDWRCARCAGWGPLTTQHRVARGMGGTRAPWINQPANLLTLCGSGTTQCHGWVEAHPRWSMAHGWSVSRHTLDGMAVMDEPVWTWRGWVLLDNTGGFTELTDWPGVPGCVCGCTPAVTTPAGVWAVPALAD